MYNNIVFGMAGSGGDGIVWRGRVADPGRRGYEGYHAMMTKSFGSQVRGGESSCRVRLSTAPRPTTRAGSLDVAVALNWEDFLKFGAELPGRRATRSSSTRPKTGVAPARDPARGASPRWRSSRSPSATWPSRRPAPTRPRTPSCWGSSPAGSASRASRSCAGSRKRFARKGAELVRGQRAAFVAGRAVRQGAPARDAAAMDRPVGATGRQAPHRRQRHVRRRGHLRRLRVLRRLPDHAFHEVMQFFTREVWKYGGAVLQAEDEIAGIGAARRRLVRRQEGDDRHLAARAWRSRREIMGLASIAELPLVIARRAARRPVDRHPHQARAVRPLHGRASPPTATCCARCSPPPPWPTRSTSPSRRSTSPSATRRR